MQPYVIYMLCQSDTNVVDIYVKPNKNHLYHFLYSKYTLNKRNITCIMYYIHKTFQYLLFLFSLQTYHIVHDRHMLPTVFFPTVLQTLPTLLLTSLIQRRSNGYSLSTSFSVTLKKFNSADRYRRGRSSS